MLETLVALVELEKEIVPAVNIYLVTTGVRDAYRLDIFSSYEAMIEHGEEAFEDSPLRQKWHEIGEGCGLKLLPLTSEPFLLRETDYDRLVRRLIDTTESSDIHEGFGKLLGYPYTDFSNCDRDRIGVSYDLTYKGREHQLYGFFVPSTQLETLKDKIESRLVELQIALPEYNVHVTYM